MANEEFEEYKPAFEGGEIFAFEKAGDEFIGKLKKIRPSSKYETNIYDFETSNGLKTIFGTSALDFRINESLIGKKLKIVFKGEEKNPKTGRMYKDFAVYVAKAK